MNATNARNALVSFFSVVSLALGGCSAGAPEGPVGTPSSNGSGTSQGDTEASGSGEEAAQPGAAGVEAAQPGGEEGTSADGSKPTDPSAKQPTQADPACVASCSSGLKTKCQGDDTFCEDVCITMTSQELSCLSSAPTCDKPEWIRCMPEQNSGGSK